GALLAALHIRGETVDEIAGCASALRDVVVRVSVTGDAIDIVGTGGDRSNSFNISTVSSLVTAAAGGRVAKHGNRAASSACGSADVLEALGVKIDLGPDGVARCVEEARIGFMFAPRFHPAMRHAGPVRREIGIRTVFNVLGPLANPAGVRRILLGVPTPALGEKIARVLVELGTDHALVVHGEDGLDEISPSLPTRTWEVRGGSVREGRIEPEDLGVTPVGRAEITGGDSARNAAMARGVLDGAKDGTRAAILMNAGAACYVAGLARDMREGARLAAEAIDRGQANDVLVRFVATSQRIGAAEAATV
ncbi:MAG: anthranilate phosphoribosyltransferase, partial [Deltaproteobacteria bacterium]